MKIYEQAVLTILLVVPIILLHAWALECMWGWYVVDTFGVDMLNKPQLLGLALFVSYISRPSDDKQEEWERQLIISLVKPFVVVFFGWVYTLFIYVKRGTMPSPVEDIMAERAGQYGDYGVLANISQAMKVFVYTGDSYSNMPNDMRESLDMIVHKIARICNGNPDNINSWDDIAGYATLVANRLRKGGK